MPKKVIDIFPPEKLKEYYHLPPEEEIEKEKKITKVKGRKGGRLKKGLFFIFLFLISGLFFLHFVLAKVNIEIWPETENLNLDEKVTVDANVEQLDLISKVIPGEVFETEKSAVQEFSSSGKTLKENNAQGVIRVYNNSDISQTLVATTRFQPPLEKVIYFRTTKTIVVPAKGYLDVEVKADRPGEEYNIDPSTFSIPGLAGGTQYYSVYGKSFSPMTGGFKGQVSQVKQEDLDSAKKGLLEKLKKETKEYLTKESSEEFIFLDEGMSQEIIEASSSVPVRTEAESFNFNLKIKIKAIAFKKSDLDNFIKEFIRLKIQNTDKKVEEKSLKIDYSAGEINTQLVKIILNLKISAKVYSDIDQKALKKALFGKSLKESQTLLENQPGITKSQLKVFPIWLKEIPENEERIKIKLNID